MSAFIEQDSAGERKFPGMKIKISRGIKLLRAQSRAKEAGGRMKLDCRKQKQSRRFRKHVHPHMDAAYKLARCLVRDDHDAQDVVQGAL
jgi:hypothetical protein